MYARLAECVTARDEANINKIFESLETMASLRKLTAWVAGMPQSTLGTIWRHVTFLPSVRRQHYECLY
jgi:hypothetical protein